jgi:hypothetical protein
MLDEIQKLNDEINTLQQQKRSLEEVAALANNQKYIGKYYKSMFNSDGSTKYVKVLNVTHDNAYVKEVIFTKTCAIIWTDYIYLPQFDSFYNKSFGWGWQDTIEEEFKEALHKAKEKIGVDENEFDSV